MFFFIVRGQEDLIVLAETVCLCVARRQVYEAEKGVWGRTHKREDSGSV